MFEMIKVAPQRDPYETLRDTLLEVRNTYHFDVIKVMHFTQDKAHPYVRIGCRLEHRANHFEYNYMLDIEDFDRSFFRLMCDEKKTIFYSGFSESSESSELSGLSESSGSSGSSDLPESNPQGYIAFSSGASLEIYYPLLDAESKEVMGCIYLCSWHEVKINKERFISDYRLDLIHYMLSALYKESKTANNILSFLKLFDDFLSKNNSHMLRHHYNVAYWAMKVADELKMSYEEKTRLYYAGLLHDIGEIYINGEILNKKEKLSEKEYQIEKNHVVYGANLVKQIVSDENDSEAIALYILQHHERYDGKGYPNGLKGKEIALQSRIISVVDAVDSMLSKRSYKASKSLDETIRDLKSNKGTQFDPKLVDIMIRLLYQRSAAKLDLKNVPILVSALSVVTKDDSRLIQGTLIPKESSFEFHPNYTSDLDIIDWTEPVKLTMFYVANQDIFEYSADLRTVKEGIVYLSNLESTYSMLSYSLFWELEGLLYINDSTFIQIKGTRISGDALSFLAAEEVAGTIKMNKRYNICLYFDNDEPETIAGKVTQQFKSGNDYLFFFSFENLPETTKERIIRRIVRKQADLKISFLFDSNEESPSGKNK